MLKLFKAARVSGAPLICITTPDPADTIRVIKESYPADEAPPMVEWDMARGIRASNEPGLEVIKGILSALGANTAAEATNPFELLQIIGANGTLPERTILFFHNIQSVLASSDGPQISQAIWNLRDPFKSNHRQLVGLAPEISLPVELSQDVFIIDQPYPTLEETRGIISKVFSESDITDVPEETIEKAADACVGLAPFPIEQVTAMSVESVSPLVVNFEALWQRKRKMIEATDGLSVNLARDTFADVGGCENAKDLLTRIFEGREPPRCIVFIDEGEKAFAGSTSGTSDSSGTSQSFLGTFLTETQENEYPGIIAFGPAGAAKSMLGKAIGATFGKPVVMFDLGSMKNGLVGKSEENIRRAFKVVKAISQGRALFYMTVNRISGLRPELRRRFTDGTLFFDLPSAKSRQVIWDLKIKKYGLNPKDARPDNDGWTGAEIEQCTSKAYRFDCSLREAAKFVVPIATSAKEEIETIRREAHLRYISAEYSGKYRYDPDSASGIRAAAQVTETKGRQIAGYKENI